MKIATRMLLLVLLLAGALRSASAELSNDPLGGSTVVSLEPRGKFPGGGSGDPFPWPVIRIGAFGQDPGWFLNPTGGDDLDGPGMLVVQPRTGRRDVVWARFNGLDYDIVMSSSDGAYWNTARPVSIGGNDDRHPALAFDAQGGRHIVWWRAGAPDQVMYYDETPDGQAGAPQVLPLGGSAGDSRPSVACHDGEIWVAFQERDPAGGTFVVVARRTSHGWVRERIARTPFAGFDLDGDIDIEIHSAANRMWVDWVDASGLMARKTYDASAGAWSAARYDSYQASAFEGDSEYMAQEGARMRFRLDAIRP